MSKAKFKIGDLVENKNTGEIEMVSFYMKSGNYETLFVTDYVDYYSKLIPTNKISNYRIISPKSVKFNLK
jgi:hypothetical protein